MFKFELINISELAFILGLIADYIIKAIKN